MTSPRLGFFTRILEDVTPAERYRNALAEIVHAEELGFDTAWVAQHHFHQYEGGLPSPFVFLAQAAAATSRIILAPGVVTLPLEQPIRVAEDAAVLWQLSGGRLELGLGTGATPASYPPFGHDSADRAGIYADYKATLLRALRGEVFTSDGGSLYPPAPGLIDTLWESTFSVAGATRIGGEGHGLMLSRTQPRPSYTGHGSATDQIEIVDAYQAALPEGRPSRIMASRTVLVLDTQDDARRWRSHGAQASRRQLAAQGVELPAGATDDEVALYTDLHVGTVDEVLGWLAADPILPRSTDIVFQPHPVDPSHEVVLRSLELIAEQIAPALGWQRQLTAAA